MRIEATCKHGEYVQYVYNAPQTDTQLNSHDTIVCISRLHKQIRVQLPQLCRLCERFCYLAYIPQLHPQIRVQQLQLRTLGERLGYQRCNLLRPGSGEMCVIRNAVRVVRAGTRRQMHEQPG